MGVSVFPAPSTSTSTPGDSNRPPKFTYSASYDLSSLSGMNTIRGASTAMTYRRTDGCIYFTSENTNNIWKFNTSTNTGSYVSNTVSWSGVKDIVSAYDGTMYAMYSDPTFASIETPQYSTDAGATWNYLPSSTSGAYRNFIGLIDSGEIPGTSGNLVWLQSGSNSAADTASWYEGTTKAASNVSVLNSNAFNSSYYGGRGVFPLRDGDDVKTGTNAIWLGALATNQTFGVLKQGSPLAIRGASLSVAGAAGTTKRIGFTVNPITTGYNSTSAIYAETSYKINKPTTIDSRWIVGTSSGTNMNELEVIDYKTFAKATNVSLPWFDGGQSQPNGYYTANPIYVSATKKLYILQANGDNASNVSKMHVYDVTTY